MEKFQQHYTDKKEDTIKKYILYNLIFGNCETCEINLK